jgi:hypothetical protein
VAGALLAAGVGCRGDRDEVDRDEVQQVSGREHAGSAGATKNVPEKAAQSGNPAASAATPGQTVMPSGGEPATSTRAEAEAEGKAPARDLPPETKGEVGSNGARDVR